MVSINPKEQDHGDQDQSDLHSTMVSINRFRAHSLEDYKEIYIPLWYLLIWSIKFKNCCLFYLHSTMVSINPPSGFLLLPRKHNLHSTMVSINLRKAEEYYDNGEHLHSTMVSINRPLHGSVAWWE